MKINARHISVIIVFLFLAPIRSSSKIMDRSDVPDKYKWDLSHLYLSDEAWHEAREKLEKKIEGLEQFKGTLSESSSNMLACLNYATEIQKELRRLSSYSWNKTWQDMQSSAYRAMNQQTNLLNTKYSVFAAFIQPEILRMGDKTVHSFIKTRPELKAYTFFLSDLMRRKKHFLSADAEKVLSEAGGMSQAPSSLYYALMNAGLSGSKVLLRSGESVELDQSGFSRYRSIADKKDRERVNRAYYSGLNKWRDTFGELMKAKIDTDVFTTRVRGFGNCLEMILEPFNIPEDVFHNLIANANKNLEKFHRYLKIRKRLLSQEKLEMTDLSVQTLGDTDINYDIEKAKELILESLKPLGEPVASTAKKALENRWIDFYPFPGKRSGGYTDSGAYREHPYVLLNFSGQYQDVSTLAHELGHVVHGYLADRAQPFPTSNYASFVAEVAAILNEKLLRNEVLKNIDDDDTRLYILMNSIDISLFDRAMVSEFEWKIHREAEIGNALTGKSISRIYLETLRKYYGHDLDICHVPDYFDIRWIFERLLFINTYRVYVYATSQVVTTHIAQKVLAGDESAVREYLGFLSSGGSDYPNELLKKAGVDLTSPEPYEKTMDSMVRDLDEIEKILDKKGL